MRLLLVSMLALLASVSCSGVASIPAQSAQAGASRSISTEDLGNASRYWNTEWKGRAPELYAVIADMNSLYHRSHTYVRGEVD